MANPTTVSTATTPAQTQQDDDVVGDLEVPNRRTVVLPPEPVGAAPQPPNPAYVPTHFDGQLPDAVGEVATCLAAVPVLEQRTTAGDLCNFLDNPTNDLAALNGEARCFTAIINLPNSHKVRVLYGLGFGTAGIGQRSPLANKLLAMYSEGGTIGPPPVLVLDATIRTKLNIPNPTNQEIEDAFTAGHTVDRPVQMARNVNQKMDLIRVVPIPAYLVYDGLNEDLDAAMVYERLRSSAHNGAWKDTGLAFCRSCMVGTWRQTDHKPFLDSANFNAILPPQGRTWGLNRFRSLFPTIHTPGIQQPPAAQELAPAQPPPPNAAPPQPTLGQLDARALIQLLQQHAAPAQAAGDEEKKDEENVLPKVSDMEQKQMTIMCGLEEDAPVASLPKWYRDLFKKNQDDKDKSNIICAQLESTYILEDGEVPLYPALIKMIQKRDWSAGDVGKRASFVNAAKGISPFAMFDFSEDDVAVMVQDFQDISGATTITAADIKAARSKLQAAVPTTTEDFLKMLRAYTNLLFSLFTNQCPLYKSMYTIIKGLRDLSKSAREQLNHQTKASMLWVILLQSRRFAQGRMVGNESCLAEFTTMITHLNAKACRAIQHDEIPKELLAGSCPSGAQRDKPERPKDSATQNPPKRPKTEAKYNTDIAKALAQPLKDAGYPGLAAICAYCSTSVQQLIPDDTICRTYAITGRCRYSPNCRFRHITTSKEQTKKILEGLKRFTTEPLGLKGTTTPKTI